MRSTRCEGAAGRRAASEAQRCGRRLEDDMRAGIIAQECLTCEENCEASQVKRLKLRSSEEEVHTTSHELALGDDLNEIVAMASEN